MFWKMKIGNDAESGMPVFIREKDRFLPTLVIGSTGTGKSTLFLSTAENDRGTAKILVDPSGFLSKDYYSLLKGKARYCSLETPISLNPMVTPYKPMQVADILTETINQMVKLTTPNERLTVKMLQIFHRHVVENLERGRRTLSEVRASIDAEKGNAETRDGILARLDLLLQDDDFKPIICGHEYLEIGELIRKQETFILDCSQMGYAKKVFIGTLVTNLVKSYFIYSKPEKYLPIVLMVDEAHNFIDTTFATVIKEGRKYQISTVLATTDFSMMPSALIHTLLSNAGTLVCFKAGSVERNMISREFANPPDILGLEKYHAAYRTPEAEGVLKAPRPPFIKHIPIKSVGPKERHFKLEWFSLEPYQPEYDSEHNSGGFC